MVNTNPDDQNLKDLYSEVGQMWRYFATWREKIVAGYLTVIAGIAVAFAHIDKSQQSDRVGVLGAR
jgi:hypothetical protein